MVRFAVLAVVLAVLIIGHAAIPGFSDIGTDWVNIYAATCAISWLVLVVVGFRQRPQPQRAWIGIIATVSLWLVGGIIYDAIGTDPVQSIADVFYVLGHLTLIAAALSMYRASRPPPDQGSLIEAGMVAIAATFAAWLFVVEPNLAQPGSELIGRWLVSLYPALGIIALFLLVQAILAAGMDWPMSILAVGLTLTLAADGAYAILQQTAAFETSAYLFVEAGWLAFYASAALAITHRAMFGTADKPQATAQTISVRLVALGAALIAMPALYAIAMITGLAPSIAGFLIAMLALIPMVLWRAAVLQRHIDTSRIQLINRETYYRSIANHASDVYLITDSRGIIVDASGSAASMFNDSRDKLIGQQLTDIVDPADRPTVTALIEDVTTTRASSRSSEVRVRAGASARWVEFRCTNLIDEPAVAGLVVNLHDIGARKSTEEQLQHQALHDNLTGLANRALLRDRIEHALARRRRTGQDVAVISCGLDAFKAINDGIGPEAGDHLLAAIGTRLAHVVRPDDTVARLGGDEFAVLLESDDDLDRDAAALGERIRTIVAEPIDIDGIPIVVTTSVGVTVASKDGGATADDLLRDADTAMSAAKAAGRDQMMRYRSSMQRASLNRVQMAADLRSAVARDQLVVHYQPIHALADKSVVGVEALVRWRHPTKGLLLPWRFVPIAEQAGTIVELGAWVLDDACRRAKMWFDGLKDGRQLTLGVNLSPRQLRDERLVETVGSILDSSGLPAHQLVLELTETALVSQPEIAVERLQKIKDLGVRLAIDDFGVGYASLNYLREFPADILKIDRSYVGAIRHPGEVPALVKGLLDLGRTLGLEVIAEGIETETQWHALQREGCQYGQGFLFSKAIPAGDFTTEVFEHTA
ncbi:MAG: EAL domain-containing protein [Nitriliruptoraceae bacterium]